MTTCTAELAMSDGGYLRCDRPPGHASKHRHHELLHDGERVIEVWWHPNGIHPADENQHFEIHIEQRSDFDAGFAAGVARGLEEGTWPRR